MLSHNLNNSARFHVGSLMLSYVMHDEVFGLKFPVGVTIFGFADVIKLEVYGESIYQKHNNNC